MPWRSLFSGLSNSARAANERVTGSTREPTEVIAPRNCSPGKASLVATTSWPVDSAERLRSGTEKSSLIRETSSSVAITVPGVTSEPGLTWRRPSTPSNGALITRSASCAWIWSSRPLAASRRARCRSIWLAGINCRSASDFWRS